ncbi:MAG: hypothetical protein NTX72_01290 [Candidatus Uhrbacteria bacterium]|nr:hypothetical protein [Candidatus Uhrbacteria bacterium]
MPPFLLPSLVLFIIWLILFFVSKETRKEQVIMSIVGLVITPALLLIAGSSYHAVVPDLPFTFGIEDLLFGFSVFGIAAIIYHVLLGKHVHKIKGDRLRLKNPAAHWIAHLILVLGSWICLSLGAIAIFSIAPIQAMLFGGVMVGMYIIASRNDLLVDALLSGLMTAALVFLVEQLFFIRLFPDIATNYWEWTTLSKFILGGIPLEEILWAGVVGFTIGPMYEWLKRYSIK